MTIENLKINIRNNQIDPFLIFTGDEWEVQKIYINTISKVSGKEIKYVDSVSDIFGKLKNNSFIQKSYVYLLRDDKDIMTNEKVQEQLLNNTNDNVVILLLSAVDKRTKFYNRFKDKIIIFEHLDDTVLKKYIKQEIDLSDKECAMLIKVCENDYSRIRLEIDKLKRTDKSLLELLQEGTIYTPPYDAIFDFVDNVLRRNVKGAFDLLDQCYEIGENTLTLLSVLYTNTKQVLQVQSCESKDIINTTGLTQYQVKYAKEKSGYYSVGELVNMLKLIHKIEKGIKIGAIEEDIAMNYLLVNIL